MAALPEIPPMSRVRCGCGRVLRAPGFAELLDLADQHVQQAHPELLRTLSPLELARPPRRLRKRPTSGSNGSSKRSL